MEQVDSRNFGPDGAGTGGDPSNLTFIESYCKVILTSDQTITSGLPGLVVAWDDVEEDTENYWDSGSPTIIQPPATGDYWIVSSLIHECSLDLLKRGNEILYHDTSAASDIVYGAWKHIRPRTGSQASNTITVDARDMMQQNMMQKYVEASDDYFRVRASQFSGVSKLLKAGSWCFIGLIRRYTD